MKLEKNKVKKNEIKFGKDELVPMIIQDAPSSAVLSLFYADSRAIDQMLKTGYVWRYSRSKKRLMQKGESSGNIQKIVSMSLDCDNDALLVKVIPTGPACHTGKRSCFSQNQIQNQNQKSGYAFDYAMLSELIDVIKDRKKNPSPSSYTSKVVNSRPLVSAKLREECEELIEAKTKANVAWEAADLLYFMLVYLENRNLDFSQVLKELRRRRISSKKYRKG